MNLPNKLTVMRVILVPFFVFFMLTDFVPYSKLIALVIFAVASVTDSLDGYLARKHKIVTNFGKFLDPLADKVLVVSALVCFVDIDYISSVPVLIIIAREFMVSALRLVTANEGVVVPAGIWGKMKTAFTMVTIVAILLFFCIPSITYVQAILVIKEILIWISTALTVISGGIYLKAYWSYIDPSK